MRDFFILNGGRLKSIVGRRWSIEMATYIAVAIGSVSPLINVLVFNSFPTHAVPVVFFSLMAVVLVLLYWRTDRTRFLTNSRARLATLLSGVAWIFGVIGLAWCYSHHICMEGHMDHPPYPLWHYGIDAGCILCLAGAAIWTRLTMAPICIAFAAINTFLVSYRFLFGSFGGIYEFLPL